MAIKTLKQKGYGIFEFNNFSGQILRTRAQLPLDITDFQDVTYPCEQGMLLIYDEGRECVRKATALTDNVMIHKSEEKLYESKMALKDFAIFAQDADILPIQGPIQRLDGTIDNGGGTVKIYSDNSPFPRLYPALTNDTFTTNTVLYDDTAYADFDAIKSAIATTDVWAAVAIGQTDARFNGYIMLSATKPNAKVILRAIKAYDVPDGQPALRFEVWS